MKRRNWLTLTLIALTVLSTACGSSGGPAAMEPAGETAPTSAANVPQKTEALPTSPPATEAPPASPEMESLDANAMAEQLEDYILRPDDLVVAYKIPTQGERRISNAGVIQERGEVEGKRYIIATGRVDGWTIALERRHKEDIAPAAYESRLELFETAEGAELAIQPEWFPAYLDQDNPPTFVAGGCNLGQNCMFYYYERLEKTTNLTYLQYHMAFTYQNVLVWVMGRGLDVDVNPDVVKAAAQIILDKLERAPIASR